MELFEVLNAFCTKRSGEVSDADKRKHAYMIRRLFSAQFPMLCECVNRLDSDPLYTSTLIGIVTSRYGSMPPYLKLKISQKKKNESIRENYDDCVIDKYMEINECGIREVEEAYFYGKEELERALDLIKSNFFDNKNKVVISKVKQPKKKKVKEDDEKLF